MSGNISTLFVKFDDQLADMFIKSLCQSQIEFICFKLDLYNIYAPTGASVTIIFFLMKGNPLKARPLCLSTPVRQIPDPCKLLHSHGSEKTPASPVGVA